MNEDDQLKSEETRKEPPMGGSREKKSGGKRRRYSPAFRLKAVKLFLKGGYTYELLCRELGMDKNSLFYWVKRYKLGGKDALQDQPNPRNGVKKLQLDHGPHRTQGTGALYQQHHDGISRRDLAARVEEERQRQQQERREQLHELTWFAAQTAWAMDSTEWPTSQPGLKFQVLMARDLASQYNLGCQADPHLCGDQVAGFLAGLLRRYGPPLFLKRDNGAVLHTPAVEQVLAQAAVLPLDSPVHCPRYNGAMEKQIGDVKHLFPFDLPCLVAHFPSIPAVLEALRLEFNARPRPGFLDCSRAEMFYP